MKRFVEGEDRLHGVLLPEYLDDYVAEDNPVRVVEVFIDELDLGAIGFAGVQPAATGRPAYHPSTLLKIYLYGYLNRLQSSRRLEREAQRNIELMWLAAQCNSRSASKRVLHWKHCLNRPPKVTGIIFFPAGSWLRIIYRSVSMRGWFTSG